MADNTLHIANGDAFAERLKELDYGGTILSWREILVEGPVNTRVFSDEFNTVRKKFLAQYFSESGSDCDSFAASFTNFDFDTVNHIVLWFEYDLFCHVNAAAVIYYLSSIEWSGPIFLVCSGIQKDSEKLFGLNELNNSKLYEEYESKVRLSETDIDLWARFWQIYSSENHNQLKSLDISEETFPYLKPCINAHLKRFPDKNTGLNELEKIVLECIRENTLQSEFQLLGCLLKDQGYYGFGDLQWEKTIESMRPFFESQDVLQLNDKGTALLNKKYNALPILKDDSRFGGTSKYNYFYNEEINQLESAT